MKLQAQHVIPVTKCLIGAAFAFQQVYGAVWNGKGVAVPVQHRRGTGKQFADAVGLSGAGGVDRKPADFLVRVGGYRGAQHARYQLRAQTDSQHFLARGDAVADQGLFRRHPGMVAIIIRSHGAAHDDQCVKLADVREWVALKQQ